MDIARKRAFGLGSNENLDVKKVSDTSYFIDDTWDFYDNNDPLSFHLDPGKLRIAWGPLKSQLPEGIIQQLKLFALIHIERSDLISSRSKNVRFGLKRHHICVTMSKFSKFILTAYNHSVIDPSATIKMRKTHINDLFDITIDDIKNGIKYYPLKFFNNFKSTLKRLASTEIVDGLNLISGKSNSFSWNERDIKQLKIPNDKSGLTYKTSLSPDRYLDEALMVFLIQKTSHRIVQFAGALRSDHRIANGLIFDKFQIETTFAKVLNSLPEALSEYGEHRNKERKVRRKFYHEFRDKHECSIKDFLEFLDEIQKCALYIILQFTGARYSEAIHFRPDLVEQSKFGVWLIRGTVIKNRNISYISDTDYWVIIPIVRMAIISLDAINVILGSKYLLSTSIKTISKRGDRPVGVASINEKLADLISILDRSRDFRGSNETEFKITTHRIRHSLVRELFRANLNIAKISFHFKHIQTYHLAFNSFSSVTVGYGGINDTLMKDVTTLNKVRTEFVNSIFDEKAILAGGAAKKFLIKKKEYFLGRMASGLTKDQIHRELFDLSTQFFDVGAGICTGVREIINENNQKSLPPCLSDSKCNSLGCTNALFTIEKLPTLKLMLEQNESYLLDRGYFYAHDQIKKTIHQLKNIINTLEKEKSPP